MLVQPARAADPGQADSDDEAHGSKKPSNMMWLTRSDMPNLPKANAMVDEAIKKANRDVPEVTQVRACVLCVRACVRVTQVCACTWRTHSLRMCVWVSVGVCAPARVPVRAHYPPNRTPRLHGCSRRCGGSASAAAGSPPPMTT